MKLDRSIVTGFSGLILLAFLAASTGVAVIKSYCHHCNEGSVVVGFVAETASHSNTCCSNTGCHSDDHHQEAGAMGCCRTESNLLRITNYFPEIPRTINPDFILISDIIQNNALNLPEKSLFSSFDGHRRYGGRSIFTIHHQLII